MQSHLKLISICILSKNQYDELCYRHDGREVHNMSNENIIKVLNKHGIPFFEKEGNIFADTMDPFIPMFGEVINLTGKSKKIIYEWLGY